MNHAYLYLALTSRLRRTNTYAGVAFESPDPADLKLEGFVRLWGRVRLVIVTRNRQPLIREPCPFFKSVLQLPGVLGDIEISTR